LKREKTCFGIVGTFSYSLIYFSYALIHLSLLAFSIEYTKKYHAMTG